MILALSEATIREAGGKARGLAQLIELGMNVPEGIVLIPGEGESWKSELENYQGFHRILPAAVRSSALEEDGESASFAGQFETFLNCSSKEEIMEAVENCIQSVHKRRVGSYRAHFQKKGNGMMPVIVQRMVQARRSGVIFTANPVSQRSDEWMIGVTSGLSEALMAGTESGEQVLLTRNGRILQKGDLLKEAEIQKIFHTARIITAYYKKPMDIEWAMDEDGTLYCLQARPITTMKQVYLNELDGDLYVDNEVFTRGNIGEMMPGPVTPLTYSVFGRAIEVGLQDFYIASGAQKDFTDDWLYFRMFYNHLFFSMTRMADITDAVLSNRRENLEFAIMGDMLGDTYGDYRPVRPRAFPIRLWNLVRQGIYLMSGKRRMKKLQLMAETFSVKESEEPLDLYRALDQSLETLNQAYSHHYCTSSQSGTYQMILISVLSGGKKLPDSGDYRDVAVLMSGLKNIESADMLLSIDRLYEQHKDHPEVLKYIESEGKSEETPRVRQYRDQVSELIQKHGHRCVREGEFREKTWEEDPAKLMDLIRKRFKAGERSGTGQDSYEKRKDEIFSRLGWGSRQALKVMLGPARAAVARREFTKSLAIKIQYKIKKAYLKLAGFMTEMGLLEDTDQIFFLTHSELGTYLETKDGHWKELAGQRRILFPESFKLKFPDHCQGYPEPFRPDAPGIEINGNSIKGLPVSAGIVKAKIRVVEGLEDAENLEKGEILVCQYTDVGWTPYFSLAAGLITEIGSPLSHGAVVAREYGLPAVVNAKGSMGFFNTGDHVLLDGSTGIVTKIDGDGAV